MIPVITVELVKDISYSVYKYVYGAFRVHVKDSKVVNPFCQMNSKIKATPLFLVYSKLISLEASHERF